MSVILLSADNETLSLYSLKSLSQIRCRGLKQECQGKSRGEELMGEIDTDGVGDVDKGSGCTGIKKSENMRMP
jgi:hypothetical protein